MSNIKAGSYFAYKMEDGYYIFVVLDLLDEKGYDDLYICKQFRKSHIHLFDSKQIKQGFIDLITKR